MLLNALRDLGRAIRSSWMNLLIVQLISTVATAAAIVLVGALARLGVSGVLTWITADPAASDDRVSLVGALIAAVAALIGLPVLLAGAAAIVVVTDDALADGVGRVRRAVREGIRTAPRAVAAVAPAAAAVVVAFVAAPVLSPIGLAGLLISGLIFAVRRRRSAAVWRWHAWAVVAVPFGVLWFVLPPAILLVPAAVLERAWPVRASAAALVASRGRRWSILAFWGVSVALLAAALTLVGWLSSALDPALGVYVTGVLQVVVAPLPVVAAAVLYRRAAGSRTARAVIETSPAPSRLVAPSPVVARVATATVLALVLPLGAVATGVAASAQDDGSAGSTFVVNVDSDTLDAAVLTTQREACVSGAGDCSFRAAVGAAEAVARAGGSGATVRFAGAPTVSLLGAVRFDPESTAGGGGGGDDPGGETPGGETPGGETPGGEQPGGEQPGGGTPPQETPPSETAPSETPPTETPAPAAETSAPATETPAPVEQSPSEMPQGAAVGPVVGALASVSSQPLSTTGDARSLLTIEGNGAVLDGGGSTQILRVASESWDLSVRDLTFRNGASGDYAGGLLAGVEQTTLVRTVFRGNSAPYGAGALFTRRLTVDGSAFLDNNATGWSESTLGGAIRAAGQSVVTNTTFARNRVGDSVGAARNQGTDIYADTSMTVVNSTFVDSAGGSLSSPNGTSTVRNSLFSTTDNSGGFACSGQTYVLSNNLHQQGDSTCVPGASARLPYVMLGQLDESGPVPFFPLRLTADNKALGAGADCPSADARGTARPAQGCDLGAVQADGGSFLSVTATPAEFVGAQATFRATVAGASGAQPHGQVTFTIGDRTVGPLALTESSDPSSGYVDTAVAVVDDLHVGSAIAWSATFSGTDGFRDSASDAQSLTLTPIGAYIILSCAAANEQSVCAGSDWPVATDSTLLLDVVVGDSRPGTVVIAADAAGTTPLTDPVATVDGKVTIGVAASALPAGRTPLFGVFTSDDGRVRGASKAGPAATTRAAATVDVRLNAAQATYGDASTARATVTVTGSGATPTGTVWMPAVGSFTLDSSGRADVDISAAPFTSTSFIAQYGGDSTYAPATSAAAGPFRFTPADLAVRITGTEPAAPAVGVPFAVLVEVDAVAPSTTVFPVGQLTLLVDGVPIPGAKVTPGIGSTASKNALAVTLPGDALATGDHTFRAVFAAGAGFTDAQSEPVSSSVRLTGTTTTVTSTPDRVAYSGGVTLAAIVAASGDRRTPTGNVVFLRGDTVLGTVALAGCDTPAGCAQASLSLNASAIGVGGQTVTARYVGSDLFAPSGSAPVAVTVTPAAPTLQLGLPNALAFGAGGDFTVRVADGATWPASGAVTITARAADGTARDLGTVALRDGAGTFTLDPRALPVGAYTVTAAYAGDSAFSAASLDRSLTVSPAQPTTVLDYAWASVPWGGSRTVGVTVRVPGQVAPEGDVVLRWRGQEVGRATLGSSDDDGAGRRHIAVTAVFAGTTDAIGTGRLTASFEGTGGFANAGPGGTEQNPEYQTVEVTPIDVVTGVTSSFVYGEIVDATATVSVPGTALVAEGVVTFTVTIPGRSDLTVTRTLVGGTAKLRGIDVGDIVVGSAGHWSVSAQYGGSPRDDRYVGKAPGNFAFTSADLQSTDATVTVVPPENVQARDTLSVDVRVGGAVKPTGGTVVLRRADRAADPGPDVAVVNGGARATLTVPAEWAGTDQMLVVDYSGDGTLSSATSRTFTVRVDATATRVTAQPLDLLAPVALVGSQTTFALRTSAAVGAVPPGLVTLSRDGIEFARGPIGTDGAGRLTTTVRAAANGPITATFTPLAAGYASSTSTTQQEWAAAPVRITVTPSTVPVGEWTPVTVSVAYDATRYPTLAPGSLPAGAPLGTVILDAGSGNRCSLGLTTDDSSPHAATGSCNLLFRAAGPLSVTASFSSWGLWEARTQDMPVLVTRGTPALTLSAPTESWTGLSTIPVSWDVRGPLAGTVSVLLGDQQVCESSVMSGSCSVSLPAFAISDAAARFTLRYRGGGLSWDDADVTRQGALLACLPVPRTSVSPSDTGTVTLVTAPTCGNGTGYRIDTDVFVQLNTPDSSVINGLTLDGEPVTGLTTGGTAALARVNLPLRTGGGSTLIPSLLAVITVGNCVPVKIKTSGIDDASLARNIVEWNTQAGCGGETRVDDGWPVAMLRVGSDFTATLRTDRLPARTQFLTWRKSTSAGAEFAEGDAARAATYGVRVTADTSEIRAVFGAVCYQMPTIVQPQKGTIELTPPAPNCGNQFTGSSGWLFGTTVTGVLRDETAGTRSYFDAWTGDTARYTGAPDEVYSNGAWTHTRPLAFTISDRPFTISASYAACVALSTKVAGDTTNNRPPGAVTVDSRSNCPAGDGTKTETWFRNGSAVQMTFAPSKDAKRGSSFLGWSGISVADSKQTTVTATLAGDTTATASFGNTRNCMPIRVRSMPAGALDLSVDWGTEGNACDPQGTRPLSNGVYDQGSVGARMSLNATPATSAAQGADLVYAWSMRETAEEPGDAAVDIARAWDESGTLLDQQPAYGPINVVAYACNSVMVDALVHASDGSIIRDAGASNLAPAATSRLGDFIGLPPADCASGANPRSGRSGYAWQVGTPLVPIVLADPGAYRFTGWSGDVSGTGETPDQPLVLGGTGKRSDLPQFHRRVTANFEAICYKLTIGSDQQRVTVRTTPNCPGVDPSQNMYLGNTTVALQAVDGDALFRHWVSGYDTVSKGDAHWASVKMTGDRTVTPYFSSRSAGEQALAVVTEVGDYAAVSSKKLVGFVSAGMVAYIKTLTAPLEAIGAAASGLATVLEFAGARGAVIDGMYSVASVINTTLSVLYAPFECMTQWSSGGTKSMFYGIQNAVSGIAVGILTADAKDAAKTVQTTQSKFSAAVEQAKRMKAAATEAKENLDQAEEVIDAARSAADSVQNDTAGLEKTAHDAWATRESFNVYSSCMSKSMGVALDGVSRVGTGWSP